MCGLARAIHRASASVARNRRRRGSRASAARAFAAASRRGSRSNASRAAPIDASARVLADSALGASRRRRSAARLSSCFPGVFANMRSRCVFAFRASIAQRCATRSRRRRLYHSVASDSKCATRSETSGAARHCVHAESATARRCAARATSSRRRAATRSFAQRRHGSSDAAHFFVIFSRAKLFAVATRRRATSASATNASNAIRSASAPFCRHTRRMYALRPRANAAPAANTPIVVFIRSFSLSAVNTRSVNSEPSQGSSSASSSSFDARAGRSAGTTRERTWTL